MARLALLAFLALAAPALAEVRPLGQDKAAPAAGADAPPDILTLLRQQLVGLEGFVPVPADPAPACDPDAAVTRGLFVAPTVWSDHLDRFQTDSTRNDTDFMRNALIARGAAPENLRRLTDDAATYAGVAAALADLVAATGCGDSVVLHFAGWSFGPDLIAAAEPGQGGPFSRSPKVGWLASLSTPFNVTWTDADWIIASGPFLLLQRSAPDQGDLLSAGALSEVVTHLRNRGADVSVILDVISSEAFALEDRQARVDLGRTWRDQLSPATAEEKPETARPTLLTDRAGALSIYYGTERGNDGIIRKLPRGTPDAKPYSEFSFRLGSAILQADRTTAAGLMRHLQAAQAEFRLRQTFTFVTTDPDHDLIVESRPDEAPAPRGIIRILDPAPTRAAAPLETARVTLRGQVETAADTMIVTVNGAVAQSRPDGSFSHDLELTAGVNRIDVLAMTRDNQPVTHSFELFFEGDMAALLGDGTRYALLIANQDYAEGSGLARLATPLGDARALADILTARYGFTTTAITPEGEALNLFLANATRLQIETALYQISRIAGAKDTVLIFYAGHGIYEQATQGAFWLPVDAQAGLPFSWLPAAAISDAILRIEAGNVLVISDSCYSGALLRGDGAAEPVDDADRLRALQRLADRRSRIVIASGGNEPVLDGGGDGHSVFARALLTGLDQMEEDAFTARELFDRFLLPMVVGQAAQEPQYRPIDRSGHEGGDVVLARVGPAAD